MTAIGSSHCDLRRCSLSCHEQRRDFRRRLVPIITNHNTLFAHRKQISCELTQAPSVTQLEVPRTSLLQFDQLQTDCELHYKYKRVFGIKFGCYVAREALIEEEYWMAAWLRAESHWEGRSSDRYIDNYKRKFAEQEFDALRKRCSKHRSEICTCIVAVKEEESNTMNQSAGTSVVGTLDISIHYLPQRETSPLTVWFSRISSSETSKYAYVSNLCVAKSERRKGIGINMLRLAIEAAQSQGAEEVYIHVHGHNMPARRLYQRIGFQMVETPPTRLLLAGDNHLLSYKT